MSSRIYIGLIAALCSAFLLPRCMALDVGFWYDEFLSLEIISAEDLIGKLKSSDHPPLYFLLLKLWSLGGYAEWYLRCLNVLLSLTFLVGYYFLLRKYSRGAVILGLLLVATSPILIRYAKELRGYQLLLVGQIYAILALDAWHRKRTTGSCVLFSIATTIIVSTHNLGVLTLPSFAAFIICKQRNFKPANYRWLFVAVAPASLFAVYWLFIFPAKQLKDPSTWWMPELTPAIFFGQLSNLFGTMEIVKLLSLMNTLYSIEVLVAIALFVQLMLLALAMPKSRSDLLGFEYLIAGLSYLAVVTIVSLVYLPMFWYRILLPVLVWLVPFIAIRLSALRARWRHYGHGFVTSMALAMLISVLVTLHNRHFSSYKAAGLWLRAAAPALVVANDTTIISRLNYYADLSESTLLSPTPKVLASLESGRVDSIVVVETGGSYRPVQPPFEVKATYKTKLHSVDVTLSHYARLTAVGKSSN